MRQLKLVLKVYDENGDLVPHLSVDPASPMMLEHVLTFMKAGMSLSVAVEYVEPSNN